MAVVVDAPAAGGAVVMPPTSPLTTPPQSGGNGSTGLPQGFASSTVFHRLNVEIISEQL